MTVQTQPSLPPCDYTPPPYEGPSREETLALRQQYLNPGLFLYYGQPIQIVDGHMQYLYEDNGRRYLDAFGGIVTVGVGHAHPHVVEAAHRQMQRVSHTTPST